LASPTLPRTASNPLASVISFIDKTLVIAELEARKLRHDPTELITRAVQPALWLLVFGEVFTRVRAIPTGNLSYIDFMSPGILAQSVLFIAIFYGIAIIWERDLGIVHKFLASPTPRAALVLGKALSAGVRGLTQAVIITGHGRVSCQVERRPHRLDKRSGSVAHIRRRSARVAGRHLGADGTWHHRYGAAV